jgi:hypothetical protein
MPPSTLSTQWTRLTHQARTIVLRESQIVLNVKPTRPCMQNKLHAEQNISAPGDQWRKQTLQPILLVGVGPFELGTIYSFKQVKISSINLFCN